MTLFEDARMTVTQRFFAGWRVENKLTHAVMIPNWLLKERIGFVWMQVRRTKKVASLNSNFSEKVMFESFGLAVMDPTGVEGIFWANHTPDEIADSFILAANTLLRGPG